MAQQGMGRRKALGWLAGVVAVLLAVGFGLRAGCVDMSATVTPSALEKGLASFLVDHSVARRAPKGPNPVSVTPEVLARGLAEYREHCLVCHGAPGLKPSGVARGLNPDAPDLSSADSQEASDGELFQVISSGVRMSGMPAFSKSESPETLWKVVAFVRHLPKLTDAEREALSERRSPRGPPPDGGT
jgi:mono/diheme cytochrome c family protein